MASAAVTSAAVKASTPTAVETSSAEARLPARGKPSRNSSMIKAAERAGMSTGLGRGESMLRGRESVLRN